MRRSSVSRISRFASSMSSSLPVSFHQPSTMCGRTVEPAVDQVLDGVGDLELVPEARPDALDRLEDLRAEHVDADQREVALRLLRLLDQPRRPCRRASSATPNICGSGTCVSRICAAGLLARELLDEVRDALVQQVVAEVHHERLVAEERLADEHRVRQAARRVLLDVGHLERPTAIRRRRPRGSPPACRRRRCRCRGCRRRPSPRCRRTAPACWRPARAAWRWCR